MAKLEKELKDAIINLSTLEKDKLLLKLVAKNSLLIQQLNFELLEEKTSFIQEQKLLIIKNLNSLQTSYSAGILMMELRSINGQITSLIKITKDKYVEIELILALVGHVFRCFGQYLDKLKRSNENLSEYLVKRIQFILIKIVKLHPDLQFDFVEDLNEILAKVHQFSTQKFAKESNLPLHFS